VEVRGTVRLNGKPLPHAEVSFIPLLEDLGGEFIATGITDEEGRYTLATPGQVGACVCENKVTVVEGPLPAETRSQSREAQMQASRYLSQLKNRPIPTRYASVSQTPLSITVSPEQQTYDIELQR
jgi:hypothetical protein